MASNKTRARREPTGGKSKMVAALLAFFLGVHQFYLGHGGRGVAMLLLTITSNERQVVSNAVAVINYAANSMAAGETRVLHIHATYIGDEDIDRRPQ